MHARRLFVGFVIAAAVVGGFVYFVVDYFEDAPQPRDESAAETGEERRALQPAAAPSTPAGESETPPPSDADQAKGAESVEEPSEGPAAAPVVSKQRARGKVLEVTGEPIRGICVRWLPVSAADLTRFRNDRKALGKDGEAARFPEGELREAFEKSVAAETGDDGAYALETERKDGVLVASGSGYGMELRDLAVASEVVPEPAASEEPSTPVVPELSIDFTLELASAISGTVVERESGEPAAGVVVEAAAIDPDQPAIFSMVGRDASSAVCGPDGTYEVQGLEPGEYRVVARSGWSGFVGLSAKEGRRVVVERGRDATGVDLEVTRGGTIAGRVVDLDGEPIAAARCSLISAGAIAAAMKGDVESQALLGDAEDISDDEGRFELDGIAFGEGYCVVAERDGFAPARSDPPLELTPDRPHAETTVRLAAGFSISGRVIRADLSPAAGVEVRELPDLRRLMAGDLDAMVRRDVEAKTDEDGVFVLEDLAPGRYELVAGGVKPEDLWNPASKPQTTAIVLDGSGDVDGVVIVLAESESGATGRISGFVVDDLGQPVEDAELGFATGFDVVGLSAARARSGPDGRFEVGNLKGGLFRVSASKSGHAEGVVDGVAAGTFGLRVTLERFARVSGRVLSADGSPPGGGRVRALRAGGDETAARIARLASFGRGGDNEAAVEADGNFTLEAPPGEVELVATVPGHAPASREPLRLAPGEERSGIEIVVTVGATVHGRVTLAGGGAVAGARVNLSRMRGDGKRDFFDELMPQFFGKAGLSAVSGEDGRFEVPHLAAGKYAVKATHDEYAPSDVHEVSVSVDEVRGVRDLVLKPGSRLRGRVVQDGKPRPGMMAQLLGESGMKQGLTGADGRFELEGLGEGDYLLQVMDMAAMAQKRWVLKSRPVTVVEGADLEVEIVFGVGRKVHGKVEGLAQGVMSVITLRRPGGPRPEDSDPFDVKAQVESSRYQAGLTIVSGDGPYEIADVEPGDYILEVVPMPAGPGDFERYSKGGSEPLFRKGVTVRDEDLHLDIRAR